MPRYGLAKRSKSSCTQPSSSTPGRSASVEAAAIKWRLTRRVNCGSTITSRTYLWPAQGPPHKRSWNACHSTSAASFPQGGERSQQRALPLRPKLGDPPCEIHQVSTHHRAIIRQVVATYYGKWRCARRKTLRQRPDQKTSHTLRMLRILSAGDTVDAVAFFGDLKADDLGIRLTERS